MDAGCSDERLETGTGITPAVEAAFEEVAAALPTGEIERLYVMSLLDRVRRGELFLLVVSLGDEVAGAVCCRGVDDEAELAFGFLRPAYAGMERAFLEKVVGDLAQTGVHVVRSGFKWPGTGGFLAAAADIGFTTVRRLSMARDIDERCLFPGMPAPGVKVMPWNPAYFEETSRIMYEESEPADREVYPLFGSPEGARTLLSSVMQDHHGVFLPGLSAICLVNGKVAGFMLCSMLFDGSVLVLDIAVRKAYRREGAATGMLEYLFAKSAAMGKKQVVLAVTATNTAAINLYRKMGFKQVATFDQHVLIIPR